MEVINNIAIIIIIPLIITVVGSWICNIIANRKPQKGISFKLISCQSYDNKNEGIVHLKVLCNDKKVDKSVVILKGKLVNTGKTDIKYAEVFESENITLFFDNRFELLDFTIANNEDVKPIVSFDGRVPKFKWRLMKRKESLDIQIIAKYDDNDDLDMNPRELFCDSIKFDFRANGIDKIKVLNLNLISKDEITDRRHCLMSGFYYLFFGIALLISTIGDTTISEINYNISYNEKIYKNCTISFNYSDKNIIIKTKESELTIPISDFNNEVIINGIGKNSQTNMSNKHFSYVVSILFMLIGIICMILRFTVFKKMNIKKKLKNYTNEETTLIEAK